MLLHEINLMRPLTVWLDDVYYSSTVANRELIRIIRFITKNYVHLWKKFINKLYLIFYTYKISFPTSITTPKRSGKRSAPRPALNAKLRFTRPQPNLGSGAPVSGNSILQRELKKRGGWSRPARRLCCACASALHQKKSHFDAQLYSSLSILMHSHST